MIVGDKLTDVKELVEKANHLIHQTRVYADASFVSCQSATSSDQCGNKYYREALESNQMLVNDYVYTPGGIWTPRECIPRWKVR